MFVEETEVSFREKEISGLSYLRQVEELLTPIHRPNSGAIVALNQTYIYIHRVSYRGRDTLGFPLSSRTSPPQNLWNLILSNSQTRTL